MAHKQAGLSLEMIVIGGLCLVVLIVIAGLTPLFSGFGQNVQKVEENSDVSFVKEFSDSGTPAKNQPAQSEAQKGLKQWFLCDNRCTRFPDTCKGTTKKFGSLPECQKELTASGRVVFIPINWKGGQVKEYAEPQFAYYKNFYKVNKEPLYLNGADCEISELLPTKESSGTLPSCNEKTASASSYEVSKLKECAKKYVEDYSTSDMIVGVLKDDIKGALAYTVGGVIFMQNEQPEDSILAHEAGHLEFNYCDEYEYASPDWGLLKECVSELSFGFKEYVKLVAEALTDPKEPKPGVSFESPTKAAIRFKVDDFSTVEITLEQIENNKVKETWEREFLYGWLMTDMERGCPNPYPACCADSPKWPGYDASVNPYGTNCYPNDLSLPKAFEMIDADYLNKEKYPERFDLLKQAPCAGGPCRDSADPHCRSLMGAASFELPRGFPPPK